MKLRELKPGRIRKEEIVFLGWCPSKQVLERPLIGMGEMGGESTKCRVRAKINGLWAHVAEIRLLVCRADRGQCPLVSCYLESMCLVG